MCESEKYRNIVIAGVPRIAKKMSESETKKPKTAELTNLSMESVIAGRLKPTCLAPAYDRAAVTAGIVHFGIGAFHRAHQAVYTDDILGMDGCSQWGITAVSLRRPDMRDLMAPQDSLFTLVERSCDGVPAWGPSPSTDCAVLVAAGRACSGLSA